MVLALTWTVLSVYGWVRLQKNWDDNQRSRAVAAKEKEVRHTVSEPWETGQSRSRAYKANQGFIQQELELALATSPRLTVGLHVPSAPESEERASQFLDLLFQRVRSAQPRSLAVNWPENLLRRWPAQREEIDSAALWFEWRGRRIERVNQRLRSLSRLRQHPYVLLIEAQVLAFQGQQLPSFQKFEIAEDAFKNESVARMRAGLPVDIWVENNEALMFELAEQYLNRAWWTPAARVLARLTEQQADHTRLSVLFESLRRRLPPSRAG